MSAIDVGPLEPLLQDPTITEIQIHPEAILCRRGRVSFSTETRFASNSERWQVIQSIVQAGGAALSYDNPVVDCVLADGTRVHALFAPLSLTLRKPS